MNEPNRPLWQIILAAAVLFGFFVLLTVIRTSKTDTTPEPPTRAESPIAEESAHTPAPTPTESTAETTAPEENGELFSKDYIGSGYKTIYNTSQSYFQHPRVRTDRKGGRLLHRKRHRGRRGNFAV